MPLFASLKEIINSNILGTEDMEMEIYFLKLRGDYYRYWAEVAAENKVQGSLCYSFQHFHFSKVCT